MTTNAERADALGQLIRAAMDGDEDLLAALVTDDVRVWTPATQADGRDQFRELVARRDAAFSDHDVRVVPLDVGGDFACAEWVVDLTHTGTLSLEDRPALEPTGERVRIHGITVAEFEGDRICSAREYWDEFALLAQLDLPDRT